MSGIERFVIGPVELDELLFGGMKSIGEGLKLGLSNEDATRVSTES